MAIKFGNTWWGEYWLRSLTHIDYNNRLPRGATYARKGMVQEIDIVDNKIYASVAGSGFTPYSVEIKIPVFKKGQIQLLIDRLIEKPLLISKLLNRELDPNVLSIAESLDLKVFPDRWNDFKMNCSCPDIAVPCKHLASVIYKVSQEIDNNPFIVFEIHKAYLLKELSKRGIFIEADDKSETLHFSDLIKPQLESPLDEDSARVYQRINFSQLRDITEPLVQLLPDSPPFYLLGNLKKKYGTQLTKVGKRVDKILNNREEFDSLEDLEEPVRFRSTVTVTINCNRETYISGENHKINAFRELASQLFKIPSGRLYDYEPSIVGLYHILFCALNLLRNGAVVPQIVMLEERSYIIRWLPAMIDKEVKNVVEELDHILPNGLLQKLSKDGISTAVQNQTVELLSLFITDLINRLSTPSNSDPIQDLFFRDTKNLFNDIGETEQDGAIKVWLERYYLTADHYSPVIVVAELENNSFGVDIEIEDNRSNEAATISLQSILTEEKYQNQRFKILQSLSLLSHFIPWMDSYIDRDGKSPMVLSNREFAPFLINIIPAIRMLAIKTVMARSLHNILKPKKTVTVTKSSGGTSVETIRLDDLLQFDWQVAIGDQVISKEQFYRLMDQASGLVKFKENYIYMDSSDLMKIEKELTTHKSLSSYQMLQIALSEEYDGAPVKLTEDAKALIRELKSSKEIKLPEGLQAELRPYQLRGYSWMYHNGKIGFGSIIADDMGLGKTIQVISLLLKYKEDHSINDKYKALVVVPTGLLTNWESEVSKFAPSLSTYIYYGSNRNAEQFDHDVMITTYGVVRSDFATLNRKKWYVSIIDEAQNIKNNNTNQSKAVKSIKAKIRIAMSGTPVENNLLEFWSIMDFVNKGYLGSPKVFKDNFATPIQITNDRVAVERFKKVTAPFMMRRMKSDKSIISDLPDKIEQNQYTVLTPRQATIYRQTLNRALEEIEGVSETDNQSMFKRQGLVLQMILALKQICNHPTQFLKNGDYDPTISGKVEMLFQLLQSITESGEKVLIFTQFKEMGDMLVNFITDFLGDKPMFYHGGSNVKQRQNMVDRFQNGRADKVFILSLKAAGTGLNLTAASHVIHFDLWWNPAVENQATDRAYRIGQKRNVMVHRFITKNTFEEKIDMMIQKKKQLADMTVSTGESWIGKLSNKELKNIFE